MSVPSPQQQRIANLSATIGSFNDEIKQSVIQVNHLHQEREQLLAETDELGRQRKQAREEVLKFKEELRLLLLNIQSAKEVAEKEWTRKLTEAENKINGILSKEGTATRKLVETEGRLRSIMDDKNEAEQLAGLSKAKAIDAQKQTVKTSNELKKILNALTVAKDKLGDTERQYEKISLSQVKVLEQIKQQEKLLRISIAGAREKRSVLNAIENQLYATETAYQRRNQELNQLNKECVLKRKELEEIRENIKEENETLAEKKADFSQRVKNLEETERKHNADLKDFTHIQARKEKDLRIVTARLKKVWSKTSNLPFPRL